MPTNKSLTESCTDFRGLTNSRDTGPNTSLSATTHDVGGSLYHWERFKSVSGQPEARRPRRRLNNSLQRFLEAQFRHRPGSVLRVQGTGPGAKPESHCDRAL